MISEKLAEILDEPDQSILTIRYNEDQTDDIELHIGTEGTSLNTRHKMLVFHYALIKRDIKLIDSILKKYGEEILGEIEKAPSPILYRASQLFSEAVPYSTDSQSIVHRILNKFTSQ